MAGELLLRFHATMIDAAQSNRIKIVLRTMSTIVPGDDYFRLVPGAVTVERHALPAIMRAIRKNDGERAATEYQRMMRALADEVVGVLRQNGMVASVDGR